MIDNDAFKLLLNNLFHLNPDDIANILCTTFNKMMVLIVTLADKHLAKLSPCRCKEGCTFFIFKDNVNLINKDMCTFPFSPIFIDTIDNGIRNYK